MDNINKSDYEKLLEEYKDFRKEAYKKQWATSSEVLKYSNLVDELLVKMCKLMPKEKEEFDDNDDSEFFDNIDTVESLYEKIKRLYSEGRISEEGVHVAFCEELISAENYQSFLEEVNSDGTN